MASKENKHEVLKQMFCEEAPRFKELNRRVLRAAGLDSSLNAAKEDSVKFIDSLLDQYNVLELSSIPTMPEAKTIAERFEEVSNLEMGT